MQTQVGFAIPGITCERSEKSLYTAYSRSIQVKLTQQLADKSTRVALPIFNQTDIIIIVIDVEQDY